MRDKNMRASKPTDELAQDFDSSAFAFGNQSLSARDSNYSDRRNFCNTFLTTISLFILAAKTFLLAIGNRQIHDANSCFR